MDALTIFGLISVGFTMLCYVLEKRGRGWVLAFAGGCLMSSVYGFLQGAWPFGLVELVWTGVALERWWRLGAAGQHTL
jgi:hypothetical protein